MSAAFLEERGVAMVIAWPSRIKPDAVLRSQFTHCIDVAPAILEAAGIPEPKVVDGIGQEPMDGTSFLYTFDDASAPERHTVQYFEMFGGRGHLQGRLVGRVASRSAPLGT
jgi:arylsulfatase A-like enzyme